MNHQTVMEADPAELDHEAIMERELALIVDAIVELKKISGWGSVALVYINGRLDLVTTIITKKTVPQKREKTKV